MGGDDGYGECVDRSGRRSNWNRVLISLKVCLY